MGCTWEVAVYNTATAATDTDQTKQPLWFANTLHHFDKCDKIKNCIELWRHSYGKKKTCFIEEWSFLVCLFACLFFVFTPLTHFLMQSKGGSCEGDSLPSFPLGPTCKVRFACPPYTWGYKSRNGSAWLSMCHSSGIEPPTFQLGGRRSNHYTIPTWTHNECMETNSAPSSSLLLALCFLFLAPLKYSNSSLSLQEGNYLQTASRNN